MAKGKKTGGRTKGIPNKATIERMAIAERALYDRVTPLEVMLEAMHKARDAFDDKEAARYAEMAAPYVHPRLQSIAAEISGGLTIEIQRFADQDSE